MKRMNLLGLSLVFVFFFTGQKLFAEDVDLTNLVVNNDFEYSAEDVPVPDAGWKPKALSLQFYGWTCDLSVLGGESQGINKDVANQHGTFGCWIASSTVFPAFWEFYQIIDKDKLDAGTYKVQCLLSGTVRPTSQRLFANQNVQYYKPESEYTSNQTDGEIATFAGYWNPKADKDLSEMTVYTTIGENDSLKIGIRTGGILKNGTPAGNANPAYGWFKVDYFRLTKIDAEKAAKANLESIVIKNSAKEIIATVTLSEGTFTYNVGLPEGTTAVAPTAIGDAMVIGGTEEIQLVEGSATSTMTVTSPDRSAEIQTYTLNYTIGSISGLNNAVDAKPIYFVENGKLTVKGIDAYAVYNISGVKVADVKAGAPNEPIDLSQGVYFIKAGKNASAFKVIVK